MHLGRKSVPGRLLRQEIEDGLMPLAPGFEQILRAERLCGEGIRCHRPPRSHAEAADSARAWSRRWAPCFITDTDKLRHMSSRFCVTMHRQTSENVDWDVEHSPGTPAQDRGVQSR